MFVHTDTQTFVHRMSTDDLPRSCTHLRCPLRWCQTNFSQAHPEYRRRRHLESANKERTKINEYTGHICIYKHTDNAKFKNEILIQSTKNRHILYLQYSNEHEYKKNIIKNTHSFSNWQFKLILFLVYDLKKKKNMTQHLIAVWDQNCYLKYIVAFIGTLSSSQYTKPALVSLRCTNRTCLRMFDFRFDRCIQNGQSNDGSLPHSHFKCSVSAAFFLYDRPHL